MQASIALTGDGPFEEVENYMDEAMDQMENKYGEMKDDALNKMRVMQYSDDMGTMLKDRP